MLIPDYPLAKELKIYTPGQWNIEFAKQAALIQAEHELGIKQKDLIIISAERIY